MAYHLLHQNISSMIIIFNEAAHIGLRLLKFVSHRMSQLQDSISSVRAITSIEPSTAHGLRIGTTISARNLNWCE